MSPSSAGRMTPSRLEPPTATTLDTPSGVRGTAAPAGAAAAPAAAAPTAPVETPAAAAPAAPLTAPFAEGEAAAAAAAAGIVAPVACGPTLIPAGEACSSSSCCCCSSGGCCWSFGADSIVVDAGSANADVDPDDEAGGGRGATPVTDARVLRRIIFLRLLLLLLLPPPSPKPPSAGAATNPNPSPALFELAPPPPPLFLPAPGLRSAARPVAVSLPPPRQNATDGKGTPGGPAEEGIEGGLPQARAMSPMASRPSPTRTPSLAAAAAPLLLLLAHDAVGSGRHSPARRWRRSCCRCCSGVRQRRARAEAGLVVEDGCCIAGAVKGAAQASVASRGFVAPAIWGLIISPWVCGFRTPGDRNKGGTD